MRCFFWHCSSPCFRVSKCQNFMTKTFIPLYYKSLNFQIVNYFNTDRSAKSVTFSNSVLFLLIKHQRQIVQTTFYSGWVADKKHPNLYFSKLLTVFVQISRSIFKRGDLMFHPTRCSSPKLFLTTKDK